MKSTNKIGYLIRIVGLRDIQEKEQYKRAQEKVLRNLQTLVSTCASNDEALQKKAIGYVIMVLENCVI